MRHLPKLLISLPILGTSLLICQQILAQEWQPVRGGTLHGISGMATLSQQQDRLELLVVHDNKKPDQGRLGIVTIAGRMQPQYQSVQWQASANLPIDLEALTAVPNTSTYMALASHGKAYHLNLGSSRDTVSVLQVFDLPNLPDKSNLEGFALMQMDDELIAVWAHRGEGSQPAILYWGTLNLKTYKITPAGSTQVTVPIVGHQVRHISDLKVDEAGVIYIAAASDDGDDGPFRSSVYIVGALGRTGRQIKFRQNSKLVPLYHDNYHKVEAIDLVPGASGGVILGTDDEAMGASVLIAGSN